MSGINITVTGNMTDDPQVRYTPSGVAVASFSVAVNERYKDESGAWKDGPTSFVRCNAWRDLAEHTAETLSKGDRVMVTGLLRQRDYQAQDGSKRTVWEVAATEVGVALRYATAKVTRIRRDSAPVPDDPWAGRQAAAPADSGPAEEPPF